MKELDVADCEFDNPDSCYHLTRAVHEESISKNGLGANIGIRSKDGIGNEKTSKVFFAKSIEGALIFLNRTLNIFYYAAEHDNFDRYRNAISDDKPELYEQILKTMTYKNMTKTDLTEVAIALGKLYLERGIYYKLDLKYSTKEEFENMSPNEQNEIDYFSNNINEERPNQYATINNMHTRTGRGVRPSQIAIMTANGKKTALDIAISMSEYYKSLHPGEHLPVLERQDGSKDLPLLEMLIDRQKEQDIGSTTIESLIRQALGDNNARIGEIMKVDIIRHEIEMDLEDTKEGVSLND